MLKSSKVNFICIVFKIKSTDLHDKIILEQILQHSNTTIKNEYQIKHTHKDIHTLTSKFAPESSTKLTKCSV